MILSVDPSINLCGVALTKLDGKNVVCLGTKLINVSSRVRHNDREREVERNWGRRYLQISRISNEINNFLDEMGVKKELTGITVESPFFMPGKPNAFGPLIEVLFGITSFVGVPRNIPVNTFSPMEVKAHFSKKSNASKSEMRTALEILAKTKEVIIDPKIIKDLSEHEVDAIAVGYCHWFPTIRKICEQENSQ